MSLTSDAVQNAISEFIYNPDEGLTFSAYFCTYKQIFRQEHSGWEDEAKNEIVVEENSSDSKM